jgi:hypothetical protein
VIARVALLAVAAAATLWLAGGLRDAQRLDEATALLAGRTDAAPAVAARVERLLGGRDDGRALVLRARAAALAGEPDRAVALAQRAVLDSPDDVQPWLALALLTPAEEPLGRLARDEARRLAPPVPAP